MKIDILRFIHLAKLTPDEKAALKEVLQDRLRQLQFAERRVNRALRNLKLGTTLKPGTKRKKAAKKAAKRKR
jgi:hypothetical protein